MRESLKRLQPFLFSSRNRNNVFYILALMPFALLAYCYAEWPPTLMVFVYGFIILLLKKPKLLSSPESSFIERAFGFIVIVASFLLYFVISPFLPNIVFYGGINYAVYILGLFLLFFEISTLKEAFSPVFLIAATVASPYASAALQPYLSPFVPQYVVLIAAVLTAIGMKVVITDSNLLWLYTPHGPSPYGIVWSCVGFDSASIFAILLVVVLFEEQSPLRTKTLWAIVGLGGTFLVNIIRLVNIFVAEYFFGNTISDAVHSVAGYVLFLTWITIYLYLFSKRQVISNKIRLIKNRISDQLLRFTTNHHLPISLFSLPLLLSESQHTLSAFSITLFHEV